MQPITIIQFAVRVVGAYVHSTNWSVKNNSSSVIFNTSEECEEGQYSECYTKTPWGIAILTLRKCYLDLTMGSVALKLLEGCFDTLDNTLTAKKTDTFTGWFDTLQCFLENSVGCRVKLCLHERLLAYLSPDTVTGDDGRHQNRCRGGCRLKWNMSQCLVRSDTVIYEAATHCPVD